MAPGERITQQSVHKQDRRSILGAWGIKEILAVCAGHNRRIFYVRARVAEVPEATVINCYPAFFNSVADVAGKAGHRLALQNPGFDFRLKLRK
jgi:hypothetical protein